MWGPQAASRRARGVAELLKDQWLNRRHRGFPAAAERIPVRHVSTRGEAPPLGFAEAMLAGLARDVAEEIPVPVIDGIGAGIRLT